MIENTAKITKDFPNILQKVLGIGSTSENKYENGRVVFLQFQNWYGLNDDLKHTRVGFYARSIFI